MKVSMAMIEATRGTPPHAPTGGSRWACSTRSRPADCPTTQAKRFAMRLGAQIKKLVEGQPR
jgi:hypothetical protein